MEAPASSKPMVSVETAVTARQVPFKVVVCGLMRTGTSSIQAALRMLGIHDVYHMQSAWDNLDDIDLWNRAIDAKYNGQGSFEKKDWDQLLAKYQAGCDAPFALFAVEIAQAYPDAKVLILNRDPEAWYQSCMTSIYAVEQRIGWWQRVLVRFDPILNKYGRFMIKLRTEAWGFEWPEKEKALEFYRQYHRDYRAKISKERVLEYAVQDGWGPLCHHLGVEIPQIRVGGTLVEAPFPRLNDATAHAGSAMKKMSDSRARSYRNMTEGLVVLLGAGYAAYRLGGFSWLGKVTRG